MDTRDQEVIATLTRDPSNPPPVAVGATEAMILTVQDGSIRPVFDMSSGAGVTCLGHSASPIKMAMKAQIDLMPFAHAGSWLPEVVEMAAQSILDHLRVKVSDESYMSPFADGGVTFFSGGAEAIEAACKIAAQVQYKRTGDTVQYIARANSYHGQSVFTLLLGDHPRRFNMRKAGIEMEPWIARFDSFAPHLIDVQTVEELEQCSRASLRSLEDALSNTASQGRAPIVVIETIGGTTLAIAPPLLDYLIGIRQLCDKYDALLIFDEILCGNYRTGCFTAYQKYQEMTDELIRPDIIVMGKGITGGYFPLSAVVVSGEIKQDLVDERDVWHTSTNQNHPIGCAAVIQTLNMYEHLGDQRREMGDYIQRELRPLLLEQLGVMSVTGMGTLWGIRMKSPMKLDEPYHVKVKRKLHSMGYACYTGGGGAVGNMILFAPPYLADKDQLEAACGAIITAMHSVLKAEDSGAPHDRGTELQGTWAGGNPPEEQDNAPTPQRSGDDAPREPDPRMIQSDPIER